MKIKEKGFTLIEMMVVVVIIGILIAVLYPAMRGYILKSRRSDALSALTDIQAAQERYRTSNAAYGSLAQVWGGVATTPEGYYTLAITNTMASAYTVTATAIGFQANDTGCTQIVLTKTGTNVVKTPAACWQ